MNRQEQIRLEAIVGCPLCNAPKGRPCVSGGQRPVPLHASRLTLAEGIQKGLVRET